MQSAAKHLACSATQNRCNNWITITCEMLRCALHDRSYLGTSLIRAGPVTAGLGKLKQHRPLGKLILVATVNSAAMRNNHSTQMSMAIGATAVALYFLPWWWARLLVTALVAGAAVGPVLAVLRNNGNLRRRLWRGIGA